jgi:hypothetical protein
VNFTCKQCGGNFYDHTGRVKAKDHADMWNVIRRYDKTLFIATVLPFIGIHGDKIRDNREQESLFDETN